MVSGFYRAPTTKVLLLSVVAASTFGMVFKRSDHFALDVPKTLQSGQLWRLLTSHFFIGTPGELVLMTILLYQFRAFERQMGSSKFAAFAVLSMLVPTTLQLGFALSLPSVPDRFSGGPYALLFALFVQYYAKIPKIRPNLLRLCGVSFSDKTLTYMLGLQLLFNSGSQSFLAGLSGIIWGAVYSSDPVSVSHWRFPAPVRRVFERFLPLYASEAPGTAEARRLAAARAQQQHQRALQQQQMQQLRARNPGLAALFEAGGGAGGEALLGLPGVGAAGGGGGGGGGDLFLLLGVEMAQRDFTWSPTDEPHATRRKQILAKYPQMKKLFVKEPLTGPIVFLLSGIQLFMASQMQTANGLVLLFCAWAIGGTINHALQLANHELSHNLAFKTFTANRIMGILANCVTGVPSSVTFMRYHMEHHQYQGVDGIDTDVPTQFEVNFFTNTVKKIAWVFMQPFFYAIRPLFVKPKPPQMWEFINYAVVLSFDFAVYTFIGGWGLLYLVAGSLLGLGLHPCAGHFIAEHYEFIKGQETYSYYGMCNFFNFNVGYHNEHHDFPKIPWSKLPEVRKIAPEFYDDLPCYTSYVKVIWRYITDPSVGPWSRVKRKTKRSKTQ